MPCVSQHQRQWRSHMDASAPMLDCPDVLPNTSEPEWHGQMLTTLGELLLHIAEPSLAISDIPPSSISMQVAGMCCYDMVYGTSNNKVAVKAIHNGCANRLLMWQVGV